MGLTVGVGEAVSIYPRFRFCPRWAALLIDGARPRCVHPQTHCCVMRQHKEHGRERRCGAEEQEKPVASEGRGWDKIDGCVQNRGAHCRWQPSAEKKTPQKETRQW